jgi:hypothetical protein
MYKLSGLREKSILGSYLSLDNKFALEELAAFIFRVSEVQVAAASAHNSPRECHLNSESVEVAQ